MAAPVLTLVPEQVICSWCGVAPGERHDDKECPNRDDETDYPAFCARCGVTYLTTCACDVEIER